MTFTIKKNVYFLLTILFIFNLTNCKKGDNIDASNATVPYKTGPGVYVCGYSAAKSDSSYTANVWKDGETVSLKGSMAMAMTANGSDVYITGIVGNKPVYWKNGVQHSLQIPAGGYPNIVDIAVSGTDVYVLGYLTNYNDPYVYVYWKNSVLYYPNVGTGYARAIAASGSDFYISGSSTGKNTVYWKNGNVVVLPGGTGNVGNIAISGTDVYVLGLSCYWKNGVYVPFGANIGAGCMFVKGSDVYFAGSVTTTLAGSTRPTSSPIYFKNGVISNINTPSDNVYNMTGIYVDNNNDVYVCGTAYNQAVNHNVATYWKNGTEVFLTTEWSLAQGIVVIN